MYLKTLPKRKRNRGAKMKKAKTVSTTNLKERDRVEIAGIFYKVQRIRPRDGSVVLRPEGKVKE